VGDLRRRRFGGPGADVALGALVLAYGVVTQQQESRRWQVAANVGAGVAGVAIGRAAGASWDELGLEPRTLGDGLALGGALVPIVVAAVAAGVAVPASRELFVDERVDAATPRQLAYDALVRIPFATATSEELLFRSALLGLAIHLHSPRRAVATSALAFGLWHVVPALRSHEANPTGAELAARVGGRWATVAGTVALTTAAGVAFAWLRLRSRSVVAPVVVHAAINSAALVGAAAVARRRARSRGR
jgi:membrane protease YdiL (CAAX protease family)